MNPAELYQGFPNQSRIIMNPAELYQGFVLNGLLNQ